MSQAVAGKQFIFLARSAPYGSNRARLCLDMALAAVVFEQPVHYVFLADGVYQLLRDQNAENIHAKTLGNALETLDLYGIDSLIVEAQALARRGLDAEDLLLPVRVLPAGDIARLIDESDCVFTL